MNLEVDFFSSQPYTPPDRPINLLVVDFDDTCTSEDTTSMIARAAITAASQKGADPATAFAEGEQKLNWLVQNYLSKRGKLLDEILPQPPLEDELDEFDMAWLGDFLDRISEFDREMNAVVIESKILSGVRKGTLSEVGANIHLRPGCLSLLKYAVDSGVPTVVVSVNWSGEMVAAALSQQGLPVVLAGGAGGARVGVEGAPPPLGSVIVHCNELEYFGDVSTGGIKPRCECAADKGRVFDDLLLGMAAEGHAAEGGVSVYIGDSMTDLSALISADVGIVMGSNQLVRQVAAAAGVPVRHLTAYPIDRNASKKRLEYGEEEIQEDVFSKSGMYGELPILYEAMTWDDIHAFLFGPSFKRQNLRKHTFQELAALASGLKAHIHPPRVLSIAGSDSGGGAGIQADIKACSAAGVFATTAVTALTAQNTHGVSQIHSAPAEFIRTQIKAVLEDIGADCIKTGMLPSIETVEAVADELTSMGTFPALIVDPVLVATSGDVLAEAGVAQALAGRLFPLATIVTPNVHEASVLLGGRTIADVAGLKMAAQDLHAFGPQWVLVKGGHLPLDAIADGEGLGVRRSGSNENGATSIAPQLQASTGFHGAAAEVVVDVLYDGTNFYEMKAPFIQTQNSHGTGCTLAAYIAAEIAKGSDIPSAVRAAKMYVWRALERSVGLPLGSGPQRPMNHLYRTSDWRTDLEKQHIEEQSTTALASNTGDRSSSVEVEIQQQQQQRQQTSTFPHRMPNPIDLRLYAVTDPSMIDSSGLSVPDAVSAAIKGGATVIQLREKNCGGKEFTSRATAVMERCRAAGVPLIINDRVDVALAIGADGVHVGQDDIPAEAVRKVLGPDCILGVSVKTLEEAIAAEEAGADYLGAGAIFSTATKNSSVIGVEGFQKVCREVNIPVVAIGGVEETAVKDVVDVGAAGVAVVSALFATGQGSECVTQAARELRQVVDEAFEGQQRK
jgi:hydroxymethylpyrimidine kinase/phosphomethylpyrimidine kinase/thiamine-phosphate diphosphorylase